MILEVGKKEIHFLMGAGASYASTDTVPFRVPLGKDLFDSLDNTIGGYYFKNLKEECKCVFRENFENGMELLFQNGVDPTWMQNALSKYFLQFSAGENNFYLKLIDMLIANNVTYSFSTTNYEMLIEQCLNLKNLVPYYGLSIRHADYNLVSVLKIHGSPNFIPDANFNNFLIEGNNVPARKSLASYPVKAVMQGEALEFAYRENGFAASLAMYAKGKNVLHAPHAVELQKTLWQLKLQYQCKFVVVIGLRVIEHDTHIWDFLAHKVNIPILYVGDESEFLDWVSKNDRRSCIYLGNKFENCISEIEAYISGEKRLT